ncbi:MAG: Gfo/Idh/MocA family oxidoreductase [Chloroflexi bacterium]|nr:Gfo/Idh/MocA family oxidoreductase [Chloroflexota bacterium]
MTEQKIRLAFVGAEHLHFRGLMKAALESPTAEVVGMAIADDEQRAFLVEQFSGLPAFATAEELYDTVKPQAIVTCIDNKNATAVIADAGARGIHVLKEKPMGATLAIADQMATTAARLGIRLMINWPHNWSPAMHHARRLADQGEIGQVWQVYSRAGHGGPPRDYLRRGPVSRVGWGFIVSRELDGGGASIDFCGYGAAFSRWVMGQPSRVVALGGRYARDFFTVDDNAIMILGYPKGHSVCEGTWTQPAAAFPTPTQIYGTRGAIAVTGGAELKVAVSGQAGERVVADPKTVEAPPLPDHYRSGPAYFTHCLLHDQPFEGMVTPEMSRDAQEILEAGLLSMRLGREVGLPLKAFLE